MGAESRRGGIRLRAPVLADAQVKVAAVAEHHREIAVVETDPPGSPRTFPLVGRALDHRAEADAGPVVLEQVAEEGIQERLLERQRPDLARQRAILAILRFRSAAMGPPSVFLSHVVASLFPKNRRAQDKRIRPWILGRTRYP